MPNSQTQPPIEITTAARKAILGNRRDRLPILVNL
jgi:hypothetical protein